MKYLLSFFLSLSVINAFAQKEGYDYPKLNQSDHFDIIQRSKVDKHDILFAMIGSIGNPVLVDVDPDFSIKNVALFKNYKHKFARIILLNA